MFPHALQPLVDAIRRVRLRRAARRLARRGVGSPRFEFTTDYGQPFTESWRRHLNALAGEAGIRFLEIGSYEGRSALWFLEHVLTDPTSTITCVDAFLEPEAEARFDHNVRASGHAARVTKIKGKSEAVLGTLSPGFDTVYVDGCHEAFNVLMDAMASWVLLKPGGVLIFDDYAWDQHRPPMDRPQVAIDLFLDVLRADVEVLHKDYQVIVRKKGVR